jgi:hypothetical protein
MQRQFPEQHRAGIAQPHDGGGVAPGAMIDAQLGVAGSSHAVDIENVLRGIGHAMHRPAPIPSHDLGLGRLGLR